MGKSTPKSTTTKVKASKRAKTPTTKTKAAAKSPAARAVAVAPSPSAKTTATTAITLMPRPEFTALLEAAGNGGEEPRTELWYALSNKIQFQWDGRSDTFVDGLMPGQRAILCTANLHRSVKLSDLPSFLCYDYYYAVRTFDALATIGADEYLQLFREVEARFPKQKFPEYAEDWMEAIEKVPLSFFKRLGKKFATGKDMTRPMWDYAFDYIKAHPKEFAQA